MGLDKQAPENSSLVLCKKRQPERLYKILKGTGDFSKRLMTFGTITGDGKILDLKLADNAKEPAQILKTAKLYLRSNRDLKFRKIRVHVAGEIFDDDNPDVDGQGDQDAPPPGRVATDEENGSTRQQAEGAKRDPNRRLFVQARTKWTAARNKAERDLEVVKDGIRDHYLNDTEQFPIAIAKLKELDEIFDNLNHELRDALDSYVHTPANKKHLLEERAASARQIVDTFADYVEASPLLTAIDQKEFADVQIKAPLSAALRELEKSLA
jgi:hypothetical protein